MLGYWRLTYSLANDRYFFPTPKDVSFQAIRIKPAPADGISWSVSQIMKLYRALQAHWTHHAQQRGIDCRLFTPRFSNPFHVWVWENYPAFHANGMKEGEIVHYTGTLVYKKAGSNASALDNKIVVVAKPRLT